VTERVGGPVAGRASPLPPPGGHKLTGSPGVPTAVAIDTGVLLDSNARLPLAASARGGHLTVYWSPTIQRESAKVVYRSTVLETLRTAPAWRRSGNVRAVLRRTIGRVAADIEDQLAELERWLTFAPALAIIDETLLQVVSDIADRPILRSALAAGAPFLLSLDQRHFPHGTVYHGLQGWHPDTFLTLFYQQNPTAYEYAARSVNDLPEAIKRRLLP